MLYFYFLVFLISFIALGISSGMVARSFLKLGRIVGLNESVVSFIMLGVITSIPEIFIAIASTVAKTPLLSIGNIIGANFANITLAIGLVALISGEIDISRQVSRRVFWLSLLLALFPAFLTFGGGVSRSEGMLLLFIFLAYLLIFTQDAEFLEKSTPHVPYGAHYFKDAYGDLVNLFLGLLTLTLSSIFIVIFTAGLISSLKINLMLFSTLFLGLITTLPELFFGIRGAILKHPSLAMGNILASTAFNSTVILGLLSLVSPTIIPSSGVGPLLINTALTFTAFVLLSIFSYTNRRISRLEGVLLISLYGLFLVSSLIFFT